MTKMNQERALVAVKERDIRLERDKQDIDEAERELTRLVRKQQDCIPSPPPVRLFHYPLLGQLNLKH